MATSSCCEKAIGYPLTAFLLSAVALSADESILTGESLPSTRRLRRPMAQRADARLFEQPDRAWLRRDASSRDRCGTEIGASGAPMTHCRRRPLVVPRSAQNRALGCSGCLDPLCRRCADLRRVARDWLGGVLAGITLAMGVCPKISGRADGLSRDGRVAHLSWWRAHAAHAGIESIGAATVLAVDKTGTLTENRMQVCLLDPAWRWFVRSAPSWMLC